VCSSKCDATDWLKQKKKKKLPLSLETMLKIILKRWPKTSPCEDHCGKQPGRQALTQTLTCLVDLVAQGEAGPLPCIVRGELDIERGARRDDGRRCYVPTVLAQQVCCFTVPISDLDVVIPVEAGEMTVKPSVREMLQDARNKHKALLYICIFHRTSFRQVPGTLSLTPHAPQYIFSLLSVWLHLSPFLCCSSHH